MIRIEQAGDLATVTMARPEQRNAFNPAMIAALRQAFAELGGASGLRAIVLAGEGPVFSAGAEVDYMRSIAGFGEAENQADAERLAGLFAAIRDCPKPVLGRIQGAAMGGGAGLTAACDIAVAAEGCRFAFSEARLGIVPAVISEFVLPKIGAGAARELFLTGETFGAERALAIGLVHRVVPEAELDAAVAERVQALLAAGPEAQAAIKRLIPFVAAAPPAEIRAFTTHLIAERRASEEGREGLAAFLERRKPAWWPDP